MRVATIALWLLQAATVTTFAQSQYDDSIPLQIIATDKPKKHELPLTRCQGDCDDDSECDEGLYCFIRNPYENQPIPGCIGGLEEPNGLDFCVPIDTEAPSAASATLAPAATPDSPTLAPAATPDSPEGGDTGGTDDSNTDGDEEGAGTNTTGDGHQFYEDPDDPWQFLPFCKLPKKQEENFEVNTCKGDKNNLGWQKASAGKDLTWYNRPLEGECGPHCRPGCVTLMLDLDTLYPEEDLICNANNLCHCSHTKQGECSQDRLEGLFEEHPKCYLENADCLGPTVFEDYVAYAEMKNPAIKDLGLERCKDIPNGSYNDDDLYCRFQEWDIVTPIERYSCEDEQFPDCLNRDSKIYWEYCNIVEETLCDRDENCDGNSCGKDCEKKVEPFGTGWTSFTLVTDIPIDPNGVLGRMSNQVCNEEVPMAKESGSACFMQRVEFYFPPDDEGCQVGCPNCHECPLLGLGDKFGPLEVVGFGHCIQRLNEVHTCNSCDSPAYKSCEKNCELDCDDLFSWSCESAVDCHTEEELGLLKFEENKCSWAVHDVEDSDRPGFAFANSASQGSINNDDSANIPAIVVPTILGVLLCCCCLPFLWFRHKKNNQENGDNRATKDAKNTFKNDADSDTTQLEINASCSTLTMWTSSDRPDGQENALSVREVERERKREKKRKLEVSFYEETL